MIPENIDKNIHQAFIAEADRVYHLIYTDYREDFNESPGIFEKCMNNKNPDALYEWSFVSFLDCVYDACIHEINQIKIKILENEKYKEIHPYVEEWLSDDENKDQIRYLIEERDQSDPISEMVGRTQIRARITQNSNYNTLPTIGELKNICEYNQYFKDIIDILYLNPAILKKHLKNKGIQTKGTWPNLKNRNGKEAVDYESFIEELDGQLYAAELVFLGILPIKSMLENSFAEYSKIIVPEKNTCGFYSSWNGAGSYLGMTLKRDLVLPCKLPGKTPYDRFDLAIDERGCSPGYCIDYAYGLSRHVWGKEFQPVYIPKSIKIN